MRKTLLTVIAAAGSFLAQAQWINQNVPVTYDGYMFDMETVDANTCWGALWNGVATSQYTADFTRTTDGGNTWTIGTVTAPAGLVISNIWPIDANTCYVAMCDVNVGGGAIYKTTDGGTTWTQASSATMFSQATSFCNVVYFKDALNGFTMGDPVGTGANKRYELWTTNDGAATWTQVPVANIPALTNGNEYGITNLFSAVGDNIWFATTYGDILHSTDNGLTWTKSASGFPANSNNGNRQDVSDLAFSDANNGLIVQVNASGYLVKRTTDGGATWTSITPSGAFYPTEIEAIPGTSIYISGASNATYGFASSYSTDNGLTWTAIDNNFSHTAFDFTDPSTGFGSEYVAAGSPGGAYKFSGTISSAPLNNDCSGALSINSQFGQAPGTTTISGPYDNTNATTGPSDPTTGFSCFGEPDGSGGSPSLDNTLWFTFTGDGNTYFIEARDTCTGVTNPIDDGDTQIAIYTGSCSNFVPVACNEDGPNATSNNFPAGLTLTTTPGTTYYMLVDGFNFQGALSNGQFCVLVTNQSTVACGDPTISSGITTINKPVICYDSTLVITTTGIKAPTVGTTKGFSLIVSNADISGNPDPNASGAVLGGTGTITPGTNPVVLNLVNNTTGNPFGAGVFYLTPVVYGNATGTGNISALTLDPNCTYTGNSVMVTFLAQGTPCPTGINELNGLDFAVSSVYPIPVKNMLHLNIESAKTAMVTLEIKDLTGRQVLSAANQVVVGENQISVDTQKLSAGVYSITINNGKQQSTVKFVKE
jgi:photosystem II stability/assembly factor-like uncharacterized protein